MEFGERAIIQMGLELRKGEEVLADVRANLLRGIENVGGRLKITNNRVLFQPHAINVQKMPEQIALSEIIEVSRTNTMRIIPNGMLIRTSRGVDYKFTVFGRGRLINLIRANLP